MKARVLSPEEWSTLDVSGMPQIGPTLRDDDVQIVAVEDEGRVVATMAVLRVTHFESLWIDPAYRGNAGVARRLLKRAIEAAKKWTDSWVWGASDTAHMSDIIKRCSGNAVPVESFIIPIGGN